MFPPSDWQARCGVEKIVQEDGYGCGIACLAMVTGQSYGAARRQFNSWGLGVRRSGRPPYSTNISEMRLALGMSQLAFTQKRWSGWDSFQGLGIVKSHSHIVNGRARWHWVVAFRHPDYEVAVFDPHCHDPAFLRMPLDVICVGFEHIKPKGDWLMVEQREPVIR